MSVDNEWAAFLEEFKVEAREHLRALNAVALPVERENPACGSPRDAAAAREAHPRANAPRHQRFDA